MSLYSIISTLHKTVKYVDFWYTYYEDTLSHEIISTMDDSACHAYTPANNGGLLIYSHHDISLTVSKVGFVENRHSCLATGLKD